MLFDILNQNIKKTRKFWLQECCTTSSCSQQHYINWKISLYSYNQAIVYEFNGEYNICTNRICWKYNESWIQSNWTSFWKWITITAITFRPGIINLNRGSKLWIITYDERSIYGLRKVDGPHAITNDCLIPLDRPLWTPKFGPDWFMIHK